LFVSFLVVVIVLVESDRKMRLGMKSFSPDWMSENLMRAEKSLRNYTCERKLRFLSEKYSDMRQPVVLFISQKPLLLFMKAFKLLILMSKSSTSICKLS